MIHNSVIENHLKNYVNVISSDIQKRLEYNYDMTLNEQLIQTQSLIDSQFP